MAKAFIQFDLTLTTSYQPLRTGFFTASGTIACPPTNTGSATFLVGGVESIWVAGEYYKVNNVDLTTIQVKGTAGDMITFKGGDW